MGGALLPPSRDPSFESAVIHYYEHRAQPARDRYFPLSFAELARRLTSFRRHEGSREERLSIRQYNSDVEHAYGLQLASFMPLSYVAMGSLPTLLPLPAGRKAIDAALEEFGALDGQPPIAVNDQQFTVYRAFLGALGRVTVARHVVSGQSRAYLQRKAAMTMSRADVKSARLDVVAERAAD